MAQFAEPVVSFLSERISKLLIEEGKHLLGVSDKAHQLQSELSLMLSLLKDADQRQDEAAALTAWISQSKDVAYEAEDVLETFAFRIASRNVLKRHLSFFSECCFQHKVGLEIEALNNRISNLTRRFQEFGIRAMLETAGPSRRQQQLMRRTYSHVEEDDFVGLENDVKMLVKLLVNEDEQGHYKVVSICGMGGLGKTTIARKAYNHPDVKRNFDSFAWVCITQQWQTRDILKGILVKLLPERGNEIQKWEDDRRLASELFEVQQNKKCLIVLDDIWSLNAWECIKSAFPTRAKGSKLLLTTRNRAVAVHIGPNGFHHEPRFLREDESWKLLQRKALRERNSHGYGDIHKFEYLGKQMVKYCRGLPLAVVVLGGILTTKKDLDEWEFVLKNIRSYLGKGGDIGQEAGEVQRILALSYNDLPYKLKPCFLYLGIYPEDSEIETEPLYQRWMAEGIVSENDRIGEESMMDTAERYLKELAEKGMVQVMVKDEPGIRSFSSCRLQGCMRDLCLAKGREENFLKVIDYRDRDHIESADFSTSSTGRIHRLVTFLNPDYVSEYRPAKKEVVKHLRSFIFSTVGSSSNSERLAKTRFNNFKMLRALAIENICAYWGNFQGFLSCLRNEFDLQIGKLVHLRYLSLRNSKYLILPSSLGNLQHLETLDLRGNVIWMRNFVHGMRYLRHLYLPYVDHVGRFRLAGLTKLEILENFRDTKCYVKDLYKLTNLQVLEAKIIENDSEEIIECILNMSQLKHADLDFINLSSHGLEKLFGSNLRHLTLTFRDGLLLPEYRTHFLRSLIELELRWVNFERDPMDTLEKLPNLQRLWLRYIKLVSGEMTCGPMGFPQLKFLSFGQCNNLEIWTVEKGAMPSLTCLRILDCQQLKMIPDGLRFIGMLKEVVIENMSQEFVNRVQVINGREGHDFDKIRYVPSIVIN